MPMQFVLFIDHIALKYVNTQKKLKNGHEKWVSSYKATPFL
jgi:hypothetical protein